MRLIKKELQFYNMDPILDVDPFRLLFTAKIKIEKSNFN